MHIKVSREEAKEAKGKEAKGKAGLSGVRGSFIESWVSMVGPNGLAFEAVDDERQTLLRLLRPFAGQALEASREVAKEAKGKAGLSGVRGSFIESWESMVGPNGLAFKAVDDERQTLLRLLRAFAGQALEVSREVAKEAKGKAGLSGVRGSFIESWVSMVGPNGLAFEAVDDEHQPLLRLLRAFAGQALEVSREVAKEAKGKAGLSGVRGSFIESWVSMVGPNGLAFEAVDDERQTLLRLLRAFAGQALEASREVAKEAKGKAGLSGVRGSFIESWESMVGPNGLAFKAVDD